MADCATCLHYEMCLSSERDNGGCGFYLDEALYVKLPCKVGSPYYTIERFCTEGGYFKVPKQVSTSDCEWCDECLCDKELRVVEHKFNSAVQILQKREYIGKYIFLTHKEAENAIQKGSVSNSGTD